MDDVKRTESGASEVIGAVLLVALVVIGGAVVAAMVFGQATPQKVPAISFGVSMNDTGNLLTLHHTGGDTLRFGEYNVTVYYTDGEVYAGTPHVVDQVNPWSSNGKMEISGVTKTVGNVVLSYRDGAGGETVLRRVVFEDVDRTLATLTPGDWTISGYKLNASGEAYTGPAVTITLERRMPGVNTWEHFGTTTTDGSGFYIFDVLDKTETYRIVESVPPGWVAFSPSTGIIDNVKLNPGHINAVNQNFTNEIIPPVVVLPTISGYKYNVTSAGDRIGPLEGIVIILEKRDVKNKNKWYPFDQTTTDADGHYSFEVPDDDSIYRVKEEINLNTWIIRSPTGGISGEIGAGATVDFENEWIYQPPTSTISGTKYLVDQSGTVLGTVADIQIVLERLDNKKWVFVDDTTTDANGHYTFTVPDDPQVTYRLRETGLDFKEWYIYSPPDGIITGVVSGSSGYDFKNQRAFPNGIVMFLNKTVEEECAGGHVVDGTYLQGEAGGKDYVWLTWGPDYKNKKKYTFSNNEQFRFTIIGNQTSGQIKVEHFDLTLLTFNVKFEVRADKNSEWYVPTGFENVPLKPADISITSINKNLANEDSTLSYKYPVCAPSDTLLRLNGQVWCDVRDPPGNADYLWFTDLHMVHDNRYGEGLNTMWIYLEPGYNYLLAQGVCQSPTGPPTLP